MIKTCVTKALLLAAVCGFGTCSLSAEPRAKESHSVVIVGGGIGALTSAIYLARSGVTPVVIEGKVPGGALSQSPKVQNWPGEFEISGLDLMEKIHRQAEQNGVIFLQEEVVGVDLSRRPFTITTQDVFDSSKGHVLETDSCILATGSEPKRLNIAGESDYWSKGVYSCAVCDGALYKGKTVAVVGGGDAALTEAEYLSQIAKHVYVIVRKDSLKANEKSREDLLRALPNVEFLFHSEVKEIKGSSEGVREIVVAKAASVDTLAVDAVFLAIGARPNSQLFSAFLQVDPQGYVTVNRDFETSVSGVYAIGDVADPYYKQAISAAGDGAKAALKAHHYLLSASSKAPEKPAVATDAVILKAATTLAQENQSKKDSYPAKVIEVTSYEQFEKEIQGSTIPVLVDFYASWCGPCRHLSPKLESFAKELKGKAKILKVNVQSCSDIANLYQIRSMPTMIVFDAQGKQVERKIGAKEILEHLHQLK